MSYNYGNGGELQKENYKISLEAGANIALLSISNKQRERDAVSKRCSGSRDIRAGSAGIRLRGDDGGGDVLSESGDGMYGIGEGGEICIPGCEQ